MYSRLCSTERDLGMADRVGQQLGHYRLLRKIGQGAFAEVYLAEHLYLERPAAIKILHVQIEPKAHESFRHEARTIAHLQHPHIVPVLDFGLDDQMSGGKSKSPLGSRLLQWLLIGTLLGLGRGLSDVLGYMQSSWPSDPLIY